MTCATLLVASSMRTSFAPPGMTLSMPGEAGSSTQRLPRLSATTDCTHTKWSRGEGAGPPALRHEFHASPGPEAGALAPRPQGLLGAGWWGGCLGRGKAGRKNRQTASQDESTVHHR